MKRSLVVMLLVVVSAVLISQCGGGGGGGGSAPPAPATSSLSGVAAKGLLSGATVTAYALDASGVKGSALGSTTTDAHGAYMINVGQYTGNVLLEASGGSYTDEATNQSKTNTALLRAAVTNVSGSVNAAITPLTEIAVKKAGTLTATNIDAANALLSNMIGGTNIITTMPADVLTSSASSTAGKNYGLMLAAISQMVSSGTATSVADAITKIGADLADNRLDTTGATIASTLATFLGSASNHTGLTAGTAPVVAAISSATTGNIPTYSLKGSYRSVTQLTGFVPSSAGSGTYAMIYGNSGTVAFDGNGGCTVSFTGTSYEMYPLTNTIVPAPDPPITQPCSYVLASGGTVTIDPGNQAPLGWHISTDGGILAHVAPSGSSAGAKIAQQTFAMKAGTGMSNASVHGTYAMVGQQFGFNTYPGEAASHFYGESQYATFYGDGNMMSSGNGWYYEMHHTTNTVIRNPEPWSNEPGTYSVAGDGSVSVAGGSFGGWVSADGTVIIVGGTGVFSGKYVADQHIGVKLGTSMNDSSLNGMFLFHGQYGGFFLASGMSGTVAGSMVHEFIDTMVFDGHGHCTYTAGNSTEYRMSQDTIVTDTNPGRPPLPCTYSVASNGTTTISISDLQTNTIDVTTWLSGNGSAMIWGGGGWSDTNFSGGAVPALNGSPVWAEQALGVKVQDGPAGSLASTVTGSWSWSETQATVVSGSCGTLGAVNTYSLTVTQNGAQLSIAFNEPFVDNANSSVTGFINGNMISAGGTIRLTNGESVHNSMSLTLSQDGNSLTGTLSQRSSYNDLCTGTFDVIAAKIP